MIGSRVLCIVIGLAGLPILLAGLGTEKFAAWAVLLGGSVAFYTLEMGMSGTVTKFVAEALSRQDNSRVSEFLSNAFVLLLILYSIGFVGIVAVAGPVTEWLKIADTQLFTGKNLLIFVYVMVSVSSIARVGIMPFHAINRFDLVAGISLFHSVLSNVAAWSVAWYCGRLDLVLLTYWVFHVLVLLATLYWSAKIVHWRFRLSVVKRSTLWSLLSHGFYLQFSEFAQFIHFQFDKLIIAGYVGLSEVAHYEIANRACMGLRSLCSSGINTFLPRATSYTTNCTDIWPLYREMTKGAMWLIIFFILAPLMVSPLFLFAWVGQIGYHGRFVFMLLTAGIVINILVMPVFIFVQAMGRTSIEAVTAVCSVTMNILFSLVLIGIWGKEGAAAGTGLAMTLAGLGYMYYFHRIHHRSMAGTIKFLFFQFWPFLFICLIWLGFERVIGPLVINSRWYMGPVSVLLYISLILTLFVFALYTGRFGGAEYELMCKIPGLRVLVRRFTNEKGKEMTRNGGL